MEEQEIAAGFLWWNACLERHHGEPNKYETWETLPDHYKTKWRTLAKQAA